MPEFHLNPTITLECPYCRAPITLPVMGGMHALMCSECNEKMNFQLPKEPCQKIQVLCQEMEQKIAGFVLGPGGARLQAPNARE